MSSELYSTNILRSYGTGAKNDYQKKEKEIPSAHKMFLLKHLPVDLDGPYPASIFINDNCEIIFKSEKDSCYYSEISNKRISEFSEVKK